MSGNGEIMAATAWASNAHLIEDVARLGYLRPEWRTLDPTYGRGTWWQRWCPESLLAHDLVTDGVDFRSLPYDDASFQAVAFDPPYKLAGTATTDTDVDRRYGIDEYVGWQGRHQLINEGLIECMRVLKPGRNLLVKSQDQVCGGKVRFQGIEFANTVQQAGGVLIGEFLMLRWRPQPEGRRQVHERRNYSRLQVFRKEGNGG
jgi:hypothetical protein